MPKGSILNDISKSFTTRDSLGIEGVATTVQAGICPIINTVTPRVFYWPFLVWIYYDFYRYSGVEKVTSDAFSNYLKRQDYFFVMANGSVKETIMYFADDEGIMAIVPRDIADSVSNPKKAFKELDISNLTSSIGKFIITKLNDGSIRVKTL